MDGPLLDAHKQQVVAVMNTRATSGEPVLGDKSRKQLQSAEYVYNYFLQSEWSSTFTRAQQLTPKLEAIVRRVVGLGIHNPTEKSFASMAAVALHDCASTSQVSLQVVRDLKKLQRSFVSRIVAPVCVPQNLPSDPLVFRDECPIVFRAVFANELPVPPPGGSDLWTVTSGAVPCRSTRAGCAQLPAARTSKSDIVVQSIMDLMCNSRIANSKGSGDIPIVMLNGHQHHHVAELSLRGPCQTLALPAASNSQLLALPPIPPLVPEVQTVSSDGDSLPSIANSVCEVKVHSGSQVSTPEVGSSIERMVQAMRDQLKPQSHASAVRVLKRPAAAQPSAPDSAGVSKRPATTTTYGCSKCRFKSHGCSQCKNPLFCGKRSPG